jgi:predicted nucleic acid-binding Zn ribbon protein
MIEDSIDDSNDKSSDADETADHGASSEDAMRVAARALGRARASGAKSSRRKQRGTRSGSSRDPELVGSAVEDFLAEQGWQGSAAMARLAESWADVVGPEVAAHVTVESWTDGELVLRADSTAWATQVRLLSDSLRRQVAQAVGEELVRTITVKGPDAPSWRAGPRVVKGRGPRDTYG